MKKSIRKIVALGLEMGILGGVILHLAGFKIHRGNHAAIASSDDALLGN